MIFKVPSDPSHFMILRFYEMEAVGGVKTRTCSDRGRPGGKTPVEFPIGSLGSVFSLP